MELFRFAILLLVQLSPIFVHGNGEADYTCAEESSASVTVVKSASAKLTKGCILNGVFITFDLEAMYKAAAAKDPKLPAVVIDISEAEFINSYIWLINAHLISDINKTIPLQFTMSNIKMSGISRIQFGDGRNGDDGEPFLLPPKSHISIIDSELSISSNISSSHIFTFYSLQLVTNSIMEISRNVITMECIGCSSMTVFYLATGPGVKVSDKSSFTVSNNTITINGNKKMVRQYVWQQYKNTRLTISDGSTYTWASNNISMVSMVSVLIKLLFQYVWSQSSTSPTTISKTSTYTWLSNIISIVGHDVTGQQQQYVWEQESSSPLTVSHNSKYTWTSNTINMVGYKVEMLYQHVFYKNFNSYLTISQTSTYTWLSNIISMMGYESINYLEQVVLSQAIDSPLTISDTSNYTWLTNSISMDGHNVKEMSQQVWDTSSPITISAHSKFLFDTNTILLLARDYVTVHLMWSYVMVITFSTTGTISGGSSMVWKDNCVVMGHKETDKRYVFRGKWSIKDGSELLLDGNYITTTDKYEPSGSELTQLVWCPTKDTEITISTGALTIRNTKVRANSATGSMVWKSSPFTSKASLKQLTMQWGYSPAKDGSGAPIPTLDNSNVGKYMCAVTKVINPITPTTTETKSPQSAKVISATAILSTNPGLLITSVVFLYLYNW